VGCEDTRAACAPVAFVQVKALQPILPHSRPAATQHDFDLRTT
jgi:hypothetical protein